MTGDPVAVTVTYVALDIKADSVMRFERLLTADERDRASRFRFERDRHRYIAGRGALRRILARRIGADARDLRFTYGVHGKPYLDGAPPDLTFNLSHCEGEAIVAVGEGASVGVDIETLRPIADCYVLARQVFSEAEKRELAAAPDSSHAFLKGWTRKEAYVKATGIGLSADLQGITVAMGPSPALLATPFDGDDPAEWTIIDLPHRQCVAALAVHARRVTIQYADESSCLC